MINEIASLPGYGGYGIRGNKGNSGLDGFSIHYTPYAFITSGDLTELNPDIVSKIENNFKINNFGITEKLPNNRVYNNNDIIVDSNGIVFKIAINDNKISLEYATFNPYLNLKSIFTYSDYFSDGYNRMYNNTDISLDCVSSDYPILYDKLPSLYGVNIKDYNSNIINYNVNNSKYLNKVFSNGVGNLGFCLDVNDGIKYNIISDVNLFLDSRNLFLPYNTFLDNKNCVKDNNITYTLNLFIPNAIKFDSFKVILKADSETLENYYGLSFNPESFFLKEIKNTYDISMNVLCFYTNEGGVVDTSTVEIKGIPMFDKTAISKIKFVFPEKKGYERCIMINVIDTSNGFKVCSNIKKL